MTLGVKQTQKLVSWTNIIDAVIDKSEFGGIVLNGAQRVLIWNQKMASYSGICREMALGRRMVSLFDDNLPARFINSIDQALNLGMSSVLSYKFHGQTLRLTNSDGGPLLFTIYIKPLSLPNSVRYCLIEIHNMTNVEARERRLKKITEERKESETRLRLLTDNLPAVIHQVSVSEDGKKEVTFLNKGVEQLLAEEYGILCKDPDFLKRYILPDDRQKFDDVLADVMDNTLERDIIVRVNLNQNSLKWIHVFLRGRKNDRGSVIIDGLYLDITFVKIGEEELRRLATTDSLTGIFNRRHLLEIAERDFAAAHRYETPLSVLLIDIDHFKYVNDQFGHDIGDTVLKKFSILTQDILRQCDIFGRLGGEEFVIVLPQTPSSGAFFVAEKVRKLIENADWAITDLKVTISIGLAQSLPSDHDISDVLKRADLAVYKAKDAGRNQTFIYSD
ncbi:MAG: diguanylate cyclase [Sneathiella sp.]|nr:diguanylate cyclase [Sneathiella sp.]